jgi:type IX secretion system PorP/SprF family membrane protein
MGLALLVSAGGKAQDIHFSQFYVNSILQNPALTGIFTGDYRYGIDYRTQWATVSDPFTTFMASGEYKVLVDRNTGDYLSFGALFTYDKAGAINFASTQVYGSIAYNKALDDQHNTYLSVGLTGGLLNRSVDMGLMTFSSQFVNGSYSANNPSGETATYKSLNNYDVGAGISLNSSLDNAGRVNYYLGAAAYHLNEPTEIFTGGDVLVKLPIKWEGSAGLTLPFSSQFGLTLMGNYSYEEPYQEIIFGGLFTYHAIQPGVPSIFAFSFGAFYRTGDAIIPTVKIDYKNVSFGFSYDLTNSSLTNGTSGANATEITLYVRGVTEHKKNPRDPIMCPRFEDDVNPQNTFR